MEKQIGFDMHNFASAKAQIPPAGKIDFYSRAMLALWHIENGTDPITAQPYFTVFDEKHPAMYHDWPDFGDLTARYLEAAYMIGDMTSVYPRNLRKLKDNLLNYFDSDGLNYRPEGSVSTKSAEIFDQGRTLYALCSCWMADPDPVYKNSLIKMVDALTAISTPQDDFLYIQGRDYNHGQWNNVFSHVDLAGHYTGTLIRPLMKIWQMFGYESALLLAEKYSKYVMDFAGVFDDEGNYSGHSHSRLSAASGILEYAIESGRKDWIAKINKVWEKTYGFAGPAGIVPEELPYPGKPFYFRSETCSIMDFLNLTIQLALLGDSSKWNIAERMLRNQLIENQCCRLDWGEDFIGEVYDEISCEHKVVARMLGGFAGWAGVEYYFAMTPKYGKQWPEGYAPVERFIKKPRLFQNCCAPAGLRALYLAWSQAATVRDGGFNVNMLLNRHLAEGTVDIHLDEQQKNLLVLVAVKEPCPVKICLPPWAEPEKILVGLKENGSVNYSVDNGVLTVEKLFPGEKLCLSIPLRNETVEFMVNHVETLPPEKYLLNFAGDAVVEAGYISGGIKETDLTTAGNVSSAWKRYPLYRNRKAAEIYSNDIEIFCANPKINWF